MSLFLLSSYRKVKYFTIKARKMPKSSSKGYCITTYRFRLYTNHLALLKETKKIYNQLVREYEKVLEKYPELLKLSNQNCMRELERKTIIGKDGKVPEEYLDIPVPSYFRRAVINQAIGRFRAYEAFQKNYDALPEEKKKDKKRPELLQEVEASPVFYKGMYKLGEENEIFLKLFDGIESWDWYRCKIKGELPTNKQIETLSPTVVVNSKYAMIHFPVKEEINDIRPVKERLQDATFHICGISFSNRDAVAVCVAIDQDGKQIDTCFLKGGAEYETRCKNILNQIKRNRNQTKKICLADHKTYWQKLSNIKENFTHKISKEILDFCQKNQVSVIGIAEKNEEYEEHIIRRCGKYSTIYLKPKILEQIKYKAFKNGILVTQVRSNYLTSRCYQCRQKVTRKKQEFVCPNGHKGNISFNSAMNIALMAKKKFGR